MTGTFSVLLGACNTSSLSQKLLNIFSSKKVPATAFISQTKFWQLLKISFKSGVASWVCFWQSTCQKEKKHGQRSRPRERQRDYRENRRQKRAKNVPNHCVWPHNPVFYGAEPRVPMTTWRVYQCPGVVPSSSTAATMTQNPQLSTNWTLLSYIVRYFLFRL